MMDRLGLYQLIIKQMTLKALLHGAIFHATCLAMAL
jgi:hypothetical protein